MKLAINNKLHEAAVSADTTILDYLRDKGLTGTKEGCASGDCGACTVMVGRLTGDKVEFRTVNACIAPLGQYAGAHIVTVEGLSDGESLHPAQEQMVACHGSQCGYCTPGFVMSLAALVESGCSRDREAILQGISGNLCRCTGYRPIVDAGLAAIESSPTVALHGTDIYANLSGSDDNNVVQPTSESALQAAMRSESSARLLAGGTDLMLEVTQMDRSIERMIDLSQVAELKLVEHQDNVLVVGAGVTYTELEQVFESLSEPFVSLLHRLGSRQIRNSGTPGGNLANGSPIADMPPVLIAWDAELELVSSSGVGRKVPVEDFYTGYRETLLADNEYIARIHIPAKSIASFHRFYKSSKRIEDDISSVMGAFRFEVADDGHVELARIAFGGMAETPVRLQLVESLLTGQSVKDESAIASALTTLASEMSPLSDVRASAEYRIAMAGSMLVRALAEASGEDCPTVMELDIHA